MLDSLELRIFRNDCDMISVIESQPAGSGTDLVNQVEEIFSPRGLLSRAKNFEYRPQQQQMAVAVARALKAQEHIVADEGPRSARGKSTLFPSPFVAPADN